MPPRLPELPELTPTDPRISHPCHAAAAVYRGDISLGFSVDPCRLAHMGLRLQMAGETPLTTMTHE